MGLPDPIFPLSGHCSVIHNGTLYVYSPAGFQSLVLAKGGKWKALPMDISLTGAQCVKADDMLYVVGGSVNATAATWDYPGLMHYSFTENKWDWVRPETWVTQNRQNHAAIYLSDSHSILVYAGSQTTGDNGLSSQTFLIDTKAPFAVRSSPSADAPPAVKPMLMPWDSNHAVMIGGSPTNNAVFTFGPDEGWRNLGVTLTKPITNQDAVQCTVVSGTDGSKVLEQFDMSVSPNTVTRIALLNQGGTVAASGMTVGDKKKRFTIQDWSAYNATFAPSATRSGYSVAQSDSDMVVVTGGSQEDPLCIFDTQENSWVNATELFVGKQQQSILQSTSSAAPSSTATATSLASASASPSVSAEAAPVAASSNKDRMLTVLGATLGAIFGIAAVLILILFCLKYKKSKKKSQQGGYLEKDRLSFADRGAEFMSEAGGSVGHKFAEVNASQTSLAIMSGRANGHKRGMASDASTAGLIKKSPLGYADPVEMSKFDMKPEPAGEKVVRQNSGRMPHQPRAAGNLGRSRSSGWSRYFANNEATNLAQMPSDRSTFASERTSTGSMSMYTDSRMYSQPSQTVPPLDIPKFEGQRLSKVVTGSPTLGNSQENLPGQPMQAELARANSNGSTRSGISHDDHYLREPVESWTPVGDNNHRPASSNYTGSVVIDNRDGASSYYPDNTSSFYPKSNFSSFYPGQPKLGVPESRDSTTTIFPGGTPSSNAQPRAPPNYLGSLYPAPPRVPGAPEDRDSTVTVFPRGAPEGAPKNGQQDMSWLNLGAGK